MAMNKIDIKPLTVNRAWAGRRFKTPAYVKYREDLMLLLPKIELLDPPYCLELEFGFSNNASDFDNPVKPFCDALQDRYGFNDKEITEAHIYKRIVAKGQEYIAFELTSIYEPFQSDPTGIEQWLKDQKKKK